MKVIIVAIICVTLIILAAIGANTTNETDKRLDAIENALRREDGEIDLLWKALNKMLQKENFKTRSKEK